ncbi:GTP 3',8-cyclase MoaA [Chitinophaga barathri]|uniref:GTP 3',8-cyclase n=1 Tax=Chitinophaga barathri TaxID=1647451 RepID=A0A3N4MHL1_9BACT|nr:GTP 3',8-cyclase MoaA [Chitinophaga barathri]RPD39580.1 GTP 3',8-cyclase MoaA [Chitinophaga barathri]
MIEDRFGRVHDYLRLSLTDNCNLRCFYCMPEERYAFAPHARLMQVGEIDHLARVFVSQGVRKIRLTGGEPLVRKDAPAIIRSLAELPVELACTTNGIRLDEMIADIEAAGFASINVSLDTLQPGKFLKITRRDLFHRVRNNIGLLLDRGIRTKINVVVMKGLNDDEITDFIALTRESPVEVRFIEFMPFSGNRWTSNQVFTYREILEEVNTKYETSPMPAGPNETARRFSIPGHQGHFSVISTMTAPFCAGCNRIRLTADGKLKNCLFSKTETDLLTALRRGEDVLPLILENVRLKERALGGQMNGDFKNLDARSIENRSMITIGG